MLIAWIEKQTITPYPQVAPSLAAPRLSLAADFWYGVCDNALYQIFSE